MSETEGGEAQRYEAVTLTREGLFARDAELAERLTSLPAVQSRVLLLNPFFWSHRSTAEEVATIAQEANIALPQGVKLDSVERLDYALVMVANDPTVDMKHKIDFFDALRVRSDELLVAQAVASGSTGVVAIETARPLSATYVLNPEIVLQRERLLVELKGDIKVWAGQLMEPMRHQRPGLVRRAINVFIPTRRSTSRTGIDALGQVLQEDTTDQRTLSYAQLELLRLYREYVNLELAHVRVDRRMVEDQQQGGYFHDTVRIGDVYSREHARVLARYGFFLDMHLGRASIYVKGVDADKAGRRKYVVALPRGLERPGMLPSEITVPADIDQLIPDQAEREKFQRHVAELQSIADSQVTAVQIVEIINSALESLGLLTHPELREAQITRHAQKSAPLDYSERYVATTRAGVRGFSVNNTYSVLVVPEGKTRTVVDLAKTLSGEFAHIIQRVSRSRSPLRAVSRLPTLGRSKVLAEAGAAKLEAMAGELFGEPPRTLNRYHYDMVITLAQGGSFWEVYNVALGAIKEREGTAQAGVTSKEARTALKTVMRVYELGGATADPARPEGRRPTSTTLLRYVLQGIEPYNQFPYYVSGVPSHRPEVTALLPEPIVGGRMITEGTILQSVVEALHHILVELPKQ